ncbi:hypothetical protein OKA05_14065 [Luteolibacter arcticus]|uniref:Uncharacterized protein n=1 Tax=Luteolibacter arcticus TaxID=1581411 RepID=A0ABT3GJL3_9BACT|nr:hypothetical protein [Luteolibacter arcticus]MCW1923687.1 hypothetical protein [Luteolibacter arcticus]
MMINIPRYSFEWEPDQVDLGGALLVTNDSNTEDRHSWWRNASIAPEDIIIITEAGGHASPTINWNGLDFSLRRSEEIASFLNQIQGTTKGVVIDVTTLAYSTWAILVKYCLKEGIPIQAVYSEPLEYAEPTMEEFSLSDRVAGVRAIPGFVSLDSDFEEAAELLVFMGFEGPRVSHVMRVTDVPEELVTPVIGVPAFIPEFAQYAYLGNRRVLDSLRGGRPIRCAKASCPFAAIMVLDSVARATSGRELKVALLGTRPHALGAVLYYIVSNKRIGLIYDFPIPSPGRSEGCRRVHLYDLRRFYDESRLFNL